MFKNVFVRKLSIAHEVWVDGASRNLSLFSSWTLIIWGCEFVLAVILFLFGMLRELMVQSPFLCSYSMYMMFSDLLCTLFIVIMYVWLCNFIWSLHSWQCIWFTWCFYIQYCTASTVLYRYLPVTFTCEARTCIWWLHQSCQQHQSGDSAGKTNRQTRRYRSHCI